MLLFCSNTHNEVFKREFQKTQVLRVLDFDHTSEGRDIWVLYNVNNIWFSKLKHIYQEKQFCRIVGNLLKIAFKRICIADKALLSHWSKFRKKSKFEISEFGHTSEGT